MDALRSENIEAMNMDSNTKMKVENQRADAADDSDSDTNIISNNPGKPMLPLELNMGDWMDWTSDDDEEDGFEGWPTWSPASFKSNGKSNEGFKGLLDM